MGVRNGPLALALVALAACASRATKQPPQLGDCVPAGDAGCPTPFGGGLGARSPDTAAPPAEGGSSSGGMTVACGGADALVTTNNAYCRQCIIASCCTAEQPCTAICQQLLTCTQPCAAGDAVCVGLCVNNPQFQPGLTAYQGLAQCVTANCASPLCPTLQQ